MSFVVRLRAAVGANVVGQGITVAIQLLSVPLFLRFWGVEEYGNWLLLAAVPAYISLADFGFVAIAINKMTMLAARGESKHAVSVFHSAIAFVLVASVLVSVVSFFLVMFSDIPLLRSWENKLALLLLMYSALLALSSGLFDAVFRASGEYAFGTNLVNGIRLVEWIGTIAGLWLGGTILSAALGLFLGRLAGSVFSIGVARSRHPAFSWGLSGATASELRSMTVPAVSFMAFPVANAISIQGMTLLVGSVFGAAFLATFSTYRTLSRSMVQVIAILARSLWPEVSRRFGMGDMKAVVSIYRYGTAASVAISVVSGIFMYLIGDVVVHVWTSGRIPYETNLFNLFLLMTALTSLWQMGMVVLAATNSHSRFSIVYLSISVATILAAFLGCEKLGMYAPVLALIGAEIALALVAFGFVRRFLKAQEVPA